MMHKLYKLRRRVQDEKGFTLIELLVVILIIGILAAIAIPSFLGQRAKGQDATAKTTVKTAQTAMETWFTDNQNYTVAADGAELKVIEPTLNDLNGGTLSVDGGEGGYTVSFVNDDKGTGNTFSVVRADDGAVTRGCEKVKEGGCKVEGEGTTGTW